MLHKVRLHRASRRSGAEKRALRDAVNKGSLNTQVACSLKNPTATLTAEDVAFPHNFAHFDLVVADTLMRSFGVIVFDAHSLEHVRDGVPCDAILLMYPKSAQDGYNGIVNTTRSSTQDPSVSPQATPSPRGATFIQWSRSGWVGSVFGCTLWMIVGVISVASEELLLSAGLFGLFLLAVGIGASLYRKRDSLTMLRAMQRYMLSMFVISSAYLALAAGAGALHLVERTWSYAAAIPAWAIPVCFLVGLLWTTFLDRSRRDKQAG